MATAVKSNRASIIPLHEYSIVRAFEQLTEKQQKQAAQAMAKRKKIQKEKLPVRHIGIPGAICNPNIKASLRPDLGYERYRELGLVERLKDEKPYRICENCLKKLFAGQIAQWDRRRKHIPIKKAKFKP